MSFRLDLTTITAVIAVEIVRLLTGRLFTKDEISKITSHTIGRYLTELFPKIEEGKGVEDRVSEAQAHISKGLLDAASGKRPFQRPPNAPPVGR
jgi:hypothetical protein